MQGGRVISVFAESMIVRNGFGFGVEDEFVGVAAARFAIEGRAPLAENVFEFFRWNFRKLRDGFNSKCAEGAFRDFADSGYFSHRERREEFCFLSRCYADKTARL